jgi:FMN phosphatase YigB (HAD superfamily)
VSVSSVREEIAGIAPLALLFDFGGTLDADGVSWKERFFRLYEEEGAEVPAEEFDRAFYAADDALVGALAPDTTLLQTADRLSSDVGRNLRVSRAGLPGRVARRFVEAAHWHLVRSAALLERLHGSYRLAVVSNFYGNLERVCADSGIASGLATIVDSQVVGCTKPDPRIFRQALAAVGVSPEDALFVGDSLARDMLGAREAGMRHVRVAGGGSRQTCCPGDRTIGCLAELLELLP